ncbi:MAG: AMP-binding protein [Nitrospinota bacterium]
MEKFWLNHYPPGIPHEIDPGQIPDLSRMLETCFKKFSEKPAFTNMGTTLSYKEVDIKSRAFAAYLQNSLGLKKGDCVAIMMPNLLQYPIALFGILRAGLTATNINPLYTPRELQYQLADSGAETIVILSNFAHKLEQILSKTPVKNTVITNLGDLFPFPKSTCINFLIKYVKKMVPGYSISNTISFTEALSVGEGKDFVPPSLSHEDIAFLQYTGGTTGGPKGAMLSHGNIVSNLLQIRAWLTGSFLEGQEVLMTPLPLYHIFSLVANCLFCCYQGGQSILVTNPRDMKAFVKELGAWKFTFITGVNTLFNGLLNQENFKKIDFSALKVSIGSGMAVLPTTSQKWLEITGKPLIEAYGMTEASPGICFNPTTLTEVVETAGLPLPSTTISIRDEENAEVEQGEPGELWVKGPQVMRGYWKKQDETDAVFSDGWLKTGDVVVLDEKGYITIVDRKKDMILVSGFNVYPNEIEEVVCRHPGVFEAAAIGTPDTKSGEAVKLFVVKKNDPLTEAELIEFCKKNLAGYKRPKEIVFSESLPKSNIGKILRRELR